jgi:hypothetical protein
MEMDIDDHYTIEIVNEEEIPEQPEAPKNLDESTWLGNISRSTRRKRSGIASFASFQDCELLNQKLFINLNKKFFA